MNFSALAFSNGVSALAHASRRSGLKAIQAGDVFLCVHEKDVTSLINAGYSFTLLAPALDTGGTPVRCSLAVGASIALSLKNLKDQKQSASI